MDIILMIKGIVFALLMGLGILVLMGILFYGIMFGISALDAWLFSEED